MTSSTQATSADCEFPVKSATEIKTLLIANRGEIAIRIARAAAESGIRTVAIFSEDDDQSLHTRRADEARPLRGTGPAAYLAMDEIIALALEAKCDAIHPGYGFLSENADFARRCAASGLIFVGPRPDLLELFGDKARARARAQQLGIPILAGTSGPTNLSDAKGFLASVGNGASVMVKAIAGGGGRGMRTASTPTELEQAYSQCCAEAEAAFGNGNLYVEQFLPRARHIEIQIIGDGVQFTHLGERECSIQRRHQKFVEISPAPGLSSTLRDQLLRAAMLLARETRFNSLGTIEFLVDATNDEIFAFLEANPRLQVEHTVTEEIARVDLVKTQLALASGSSLAELGLDQSQSRVQSGFAMELRINAETLDSQVRARPSHGVIASFEPPSGLGIRVDTSGYSGYRINPRFDSLLAKLITYSPSSKFEDVLARARRALSEFRIDGVPTNIPLLERLLQHPDFRAGQMYTRFFEDHLAELTGEDAPAAVTMPSVNDQNLPLQVGPEGTLPVSAGMQATVVSVDVIAGDRVHEGRQIAVLEAMKMQHVVTAQTAGIVRHVNVRPGDMVFDGHALLFLEPASVEAPTAEKETEIDLAHVRPDLAEVIERHAIGSDERRPDAVARRRKTGQRTARENIADLCDPGSFTEYGALAIAAQRRRRSLDDLIKNTPADGLLAGIGTVNGALFSQDLVRCMAIAYDYTVLAGTQGTLNHKKLDHMIRLAEQWRLPIVLFAEGGGGRPGDTDGLAGAHLDVVTFYKFARLSGLTPLIGVVSGRCFAGNAALLGCCDVIIATQNSSIGMAGPAMIEGGGLGVYDPDEVGPIQVQTRNGVVDIAVQDEAEAVQAAKKYLSCFQGYLTGSSAADQRLLRTLIPENRLRVYDIRKVIEVLADTGWFLELRRDWAPGMITGFIRIEGWPMGLIANNPAHLAGAIDPDGADKAARFMQVCEAYGLPILSLCDTPGFMVGPEIEKKAQVRHTSRMFLSGANLTVPYLMVTLRKGYGLGAQAMAGGCFSTPLLHVSWPTGEFGPMGLEGAVKLGYRKELEAIQDPQERQRLFAQMLANAYDNGKAINVASFLEFDDVIDPAETRTYIMRALKSLPPSARASGKRRPFIDAW